MQLGKLDSFIAERQKWADFYQRELAGIKWLLTPEVPEGLRHVWQSYVCYVDPAAAPSPRNDIMERLQEKGVSPRPGTHAVHMLGYYRDRFGYQPDDLPAARDCDHNSMAIPLYNGMTEDDYAWVVEAICSIT